MGKRSDFTRIARDLYKTPWEPVVALSPFLQDVTAFVEPCCGDGTLIAHLERLGHECAWASDIQPMEPWQAGEVLVEIHPVDRITELDLVGFDDPPISHFITNPPWPKARGHDGNPTTGIIKHLSALRPSWFLLPADLMHNVYAREVMSFCTTIVSVGRVKWMPGSEHMGMENCAWYLFDRQRPSATLFYARGDGKPAYAPDLEALL